MMLAHNVVDDPFGHARENDHHQGADDGASERPECERGITLQVTKNAPDRFHSRAKLSQLRAVQHLGGSAAPRTMLKKSGAAAKSLTSSKGLLDPPSQRRSPECLCRPLNVSSAMPDLSSSPKPSAIMRSYCSLVARASGRSRPRLRASSSAIPLSLAACAAEKKQLCSRFCMSSPSVSRTREFAPVCEKTSRNNLRSRPSAAPRPRPSARPAVLMFITMLTSAFTLPASPAFPTKRIWAASSFKIGSAFRNASSFPPHIR